LRPAVACTVQVRLDGENAAEIVHGEFRLGHGQGQQPALESGVAVLRRSFQTPANDRQRAGQVARLLVRLGQEPASVWVVGMEPEPALEVGDRLRPLLLLVE
jgi:hypothetical protein